MTHSGTTEVRVFDALAPGSQFLVDDKPILKTERVYDGDNECWFNAVEIQTGILRYFGDKDLVAVGPELAKKETQEEAEERFRLWRRSGMFDPIRDAFLAGARVKSPWEKL